MLSFRAEGAEGTEGFRNEEPEPLPESTTGDAGSADASPGANKTPNEVRKKRWERLKTKVGNDDLSNLLETADDDEGDEGLLGSFEDVMCSPVHKMLGYTRLPCVDPSETAALQRSPPRAVVQALRRAVLKLLQSVVFQCCTVSCIVGNALVIGFETDMPHDKIWDTVEMAFLWVFSFEVVFRLFVHGPRKYFWGGSSRPRVGRLARQRESEGSDVIWNIFDFTIVGAGWMMVGMDKFVGDLGDSQKDATLLRAVRLLRLLRILRVVRVVRFLKQLYLLAYGFMEGASAVFWVAVLAASCIYLCAVVLVRAFQAMSPENESYEFFQAHFHNIPGAMFSLFQTMASPNLGEYRPVLGQEPFLAAFIVPFVIFGSLGMNGLLTGVISESIMEKNQARIEATRQEREGKRRLLEDSCCQLFDEVCGGPGKQMTANQFRGCMDDIKALVSEAGCAVVSEDLESMFLAMDYSDTGQLERADFVHGILELCEDVRPMSIMEIHCQISRCQMQMEKCNGSVDQLITLHKQQMARQARASRLMLMSEDNGPDGMQQARGASGMLRGTSQGTAGGHGGGRESRSASGYLSGASPDQSPCVSSSLRRGSTRQLPMLEEEPFSPREVPPGSNGAQEVASLAMLQQRLAVSARNGSGRARADLALVGKELARLMRENCELLQRHASCLPEEPGPASSPLISHV